MQQYADIYSLQNYSTCFGVTAPIIRSIKNCTRSLRYRSYYLYRYSPPTWSGLDYFVRVLLKGRKKNEGLFVGGGVNILKILSHVYVASSDISIRTN